ncbi:hypothetical protein BASA81_004202 [Batrachochytrium salamandrivorans]|nr:hypothetical protein BASA81_004202 [Batrachochytrium salamandrivorans]
MQQLAQRDDALERFNRLSVREIEDWNDGAASFLARFQSTALRLETDGRIKLKVAYTRENMELLKAVLADPQASKICSLQWEYNREEDVNSIIPLLINSCPELASLLVEFGNHSVFDFVSSVLEHPSNKIKVLALSRYAEGDLARFFAALGQSQVSALTLCYSPEFTQGWYEYLARDLLVSLKVRGRDQAPSELMMSLANCTRLAELGLMGFKFAQPTALTHFPKCVTKLMLFYCAFVGGFDWLFLIGSNVRELDLSYLKDVDGNQLGNALAVYLKAKGLDKLRFYNCGFVDETLAVVDIELGRTKRLEIHGQLNDDSLGLIALALRSPNNEMKELWLWSEGHMMSNIENRLVPALKHPNCNLAELHFIPDQQEYESAVKTMSEFHNRRALFALLQGQQFNGIGGKALKDFGLTLLFRGGNLVLAALRGLLGLGDQSRAPSLNQSFQLLLTNRKTCSDLKFIGNGRSRVPSGPFLPAKQSPAYRPTWT